MSSSSSSSISSISSISTISTIRSYSRVIERPQVGLGPERIQVVIRTSSDGAPTEVGLFNHAHREYLVAHGSSKPAVDSTLGYRLPAAQDADAFVDALLEEYQKPIGFLQMMFGYGVMARQRFDAEYCEAVAEATTRHLIETGDVAPDAPRADAN